MTDSHDDARAAILDRLADDIVTGRRAHPTRVAIDGITAAGKTTFADALADVVGATGRPSVRVTMDGFHHPAAHRYRQGRTADGYYEDAYDFPAFRREVLDPLGAGGTARFRPAIIDLDTDRELQPGVVTVPASTVVIVDGSFLQRPELDGGWDFVVFLDADLGVAAARGARRDASRLGSEEQAQELFAVRYHPAQARYIRECSPGARADVVIDNTDPRRPIVERWGRVAH